MISVDGGEGNDTLNAGNGNNYLVAGDGNDSLASGSGEDTLYGQAGDDILRGGEGDDIYYGDSGNDTLRESDQSYGLDTLDGGTGDDSLYGAGNNDIYIFNKGYGVDTISDSVLIPQYARPAKLGSGGESDTVMFGTGITLDNLTWNFDGKDLTFTLTDSPDDSLTIENYYNSFYRIENFEVEGNQILAPEIIGAKRWRDTSNHNYFSWLESSVSYQGLAGNDTIISGVGNDRLWGNYGDDTITSGVGDDTLIGNVGNDILNGEDGNDNLNGGDGDDTLNGGNGNNYLTAGQGNDSLVASSGQDTLYGGDGNDTLRSSRGNDVYYGGDGNDLIEDGYATFDNDTLDGGYGNDTLKGGGNNDTYIFNRGYGSDVIEDYGIARYAYSADRVSNGGNNDTITFGSDITRNDLRWNFEGADLIFTLVDSPEDKLTIKNYDNSFYQIENVQIEGTQILLEEIISTNIQQDSSGTNSLTWLDSGINYQGLEGNDSITTGDYKDTIDGGNDNDLIASGGGDDVINGGEGNDTLDSGLGNDTIEGDNGNDTYIFDRGYGIDLISDYGNTDSTNSSEDSESNDTIVFGSIISRDDLIWNFDGKDLTFTLIDSPNDKLVVANYTDPLYRIENFEVEGNQIPVAEIMGSQRWRDTSKNDSFSWLESSIDYQRLGGNDIITTGSGNDRLWGNYGNDVINSGDGNDTLIGNVGNDILNGEAGNDRLDGGEGNDRLDGGEGNDTYIFKPGYDSNIITDYDATSDAGNNDTILFDSAISRDNLALDITGDDLIITLIDSPSDRLIIENYDAPAYRIENVLIKGSQISLEELITST